VTLNSGAIKKIENFMADKNIFIADCNHRYETAENYANETGTALEQPLCQRANGRREG